MNMSSTGPVLVRPDRSGTLLLPRDPASVAKARRWLWRLLGAEQVSALRCQDAVLMLSELATNGLRHGQGEVIVRATIRRDGTILIAVNDGGDRTTSAAEPQVQHVDMNRLGGMGLRIVGALSTDWGVVRYPGGTTVWVELAGGNAA